MKAIFDNLTYLSFRILVAALNILPIKFRITIIELLIRLVTRIIPKYRKIAVRNLERAFPEKDREWRDRILSQCHKSLARLLVDFFRVPGVTAADCDKNFDFALKTRLLELVKQGKPIVFATGHLGSFELLAHYLALIGVPLAFVARALKPPQLDAWWTARREANGNSVIERSGALKGTLRHLKNGKAVGVLFDQNITRQHAVFVDWFGHIAATSKLLGIAAVRTNAAVVVISMQYLHDSKYKINAVECDFESLYSDSTMDTEDKILEITKRVSHEYVEMIRRHPDEWFWMHRRWKTAPEGEPENFYQ